MRLRMVANSIEQGEGADKAPDTPATQTDTYTQGPWGTPCRSRWTASTTSPTRSSRCSWTTASWHRGPTTTSCHCTRRTTSASQSAKQAHPGTSVLRDQLPAQNHIYHNGKSNNVLGPTLELTAASTLAVMRCFTESRTTHEFSLIRPGNWAFRNANGSVI